MFTVILKRSGQKETFQPQKITDAIFKPRRRSVATICKRPNS